MRGLGRFLGWLVALADSGAVPPVPVIPTYGVSSNGSGSNNYVRTATLPNKNPLTIRAWVKRQVDRDNYSGWCALNKSGDELFYCGTDFNGDTLMAYFGDSVNDSADGTLTDGDWHHVVYTYNGADVDIYVDGVFVYHTTSAQAGDAAISLTVLTTDFGSWFSGAVQGLAIWEEVLTPEDVTADLEHIEPSHTTNLWAWYLFDGVDDCLDRSGNSRHLTKVGTPTVTAGPGVPL